MPDNDGVHKRAHMPGEGEAGGFDRLRRHGMMRRGGRGLDTSQKAERAGDQTVEVIVLAVWRLDIATKPTRCGTDGSSQCRFDGLVIAIAGPAALTRIAQCGVP